MAVKRFKGTFFALAAAALVALLAGCDGLFGGSSGTGGTESGTGSAGGQTDYAGVGYGPWTAPMAHGGSITAEGVPGGIRITKQDPQLNNISTIMVCVWEAGTGADGATYEAYNRVFYPGGSSGPEGVDWPEISTNNKNDFIYTFTRKDVVYAVRLIAWTSGIEVQSDIAYVRAGGGIGDLRTIIYDSGYDRAEGRLWFDVKEERPAALPAGGEFWYQIGLDALEPGAICPWQNWGSARTEFTEIPYLFDDYELGLTEITASLESPENTPFPFRVFYNFLYRVSPDEVYQGNIMTTYKKLFNAD